MWQQSWQQSRQQATKFIFLIIFAATKVCCHF
nr:MAG TPA: hypothetical protein [Caudoviricetes sp.]DAS55379.1 MAG TPA: hypothetical protein [Caudoviricetes sp.]